MSILMTPLWIFSANNDYASSSFQGGACYYKISSITCRQDFRDKLKEISKRIDMQQYDLYTLLDAKDTRGLNESYTAGIGQLLILWQNSGGFRGDFFEFYLPCVFFRHCLVFDRSPSYGEYVARDFLSLSIHGLYVDRERSGFSDPHASVRKAIKHFACASVLTAESIDNPCLETMHKAVSLCAQSGKEQKEDLTFALKCLMRTV